MRRIGAAGAGILGLVLAASASLAADIPGRMPTKGPVVAAPGYSWYGFYIGAHAGYSWSDDTLTMTGLPALPATIAPGFSFDRDGAIAGIQWGTNWQFGRWVLGTESDISFADFDESQTIVFGGATNLVNQEIQYLGTTRGRVGYAFDNILIYATGGLASGRVETTYLETTTGFVGTRSKHRYGFSAGGGIEWGFGPWSAKLEYLHYDLGDHSFLVFAPGGAVVATANSDNSGDMVRAGLNYRFNWTPWQLITGRR